MADELMLYEESSVRSVSSALRYLNGKDTKYSHVEHPLEIRKAKNKIKPFFDWGACYNKSCISTNTYTPMPRWYGLLPLFKANDSNMIINMSYGFAGRDRHQTSNVICSFSFSPCSGLTVGSNYDEAQPSDWNPDDEDIPFLVNGTQAFTFKQFDDIRVVINTESTPTVSFFKNEVPACEDITLSSSVYSSRDTSSLICGMYPGTQNDMFFSNVKFFRIMIDPWES